MSEEVANKIQVMADLIVLTMQQQGATIHPANALHLARRLHQLEAPINEIKQSFRNRYQQGD
jgi:hypothetical protein